MTTTDRYRYEKLEGVQSYSIFLHPDNQYRIVLVLWYPNGSRAQHEVPILQPMLAAPTHSATRGVPS